MAVKTVFIKTTTTNTAQTWTIPSDFVSLVGVHAIGYGCYYGDGTLATNPGGGGGAYAYSNAITGLAANQTVYFKNYFASISGTTETWFNKTNAAPTASSTGVKAVGANKYGSGGSSSSCVGTVAYSGGNGGGSSDANGSGGGGGAAGPNGAGGNGGSVSGSSGGFSYAAGGGGGGANGGGSGAATIQRATPPYQVEGGVGGTNRFGTGAGNKAVTVPSLTSKATSGSNGGGGGGGAYASDTSYRQGGSGSQDSIWTQTSDGELAGPGSGAGGAGGARNYAGVAGTYGGGGAAYGSNAQGIIVFVYNVADPVITIDTQPTNQTVTEPDGATFSVAATASYGTLTYQWQKADAATPTSWSNISGATSSSYTKTPTSYAIDNGDLFRCVITVSGYGVTSTSNSATLTVKSLSTGNFFMVF